MSLACSCLFLQNFVAAISLSQETLYFKWDVWEVTSYKTWILRTVKSNWKYEVTSWEKNCSEDVIELSSVACCNPDPRELLNIYVLHPLIPKREVWGVQWKTDSLLWYTSWSGRLNLHMDIVIKTLHSRKKIQILLLLSPASQWRRTHTWRRNDGSVRKTVKKKGGV